MDGEGSRKACEPSEIDTDRSVEIISISKIEEAIETIHASLGFLRDAGMISKGKLDLILDQMPPDLSETAPKDMLPLHRVLYFLYRVLPKLSRQEGQETGCYDEFRLPHDYWNKFQLTLASSCDISKFNQVNYEYNFKTGQFRFTKPLSRAQTTAFDLVKWLILRSLNSIRTQHLPTWLQDQNYAYPRLALGCCLINGTEVYKVPDVQFRFPYSWEKRYSAAHANVVGVVGIAWLGSNRRVTEEIVGFLKYAKGGIYFGVILRIGCDFEHPERTPNPAATFDILRYKASDGNGKRVVQIQRSSYEIRTKEGDVKEGTVKFYIGDIRPKRIPCPAGISDHDTIDIPFREVLKIVDDIIKTSGSDEAHRRRLQTHGTNRRATSRFESHQR